MARQKVQRKIWLSKSTAARLDELAERRGQTYSDIIGEQIDKAYSDHDGYFLQKAAIQSWTAATLSRTLLNVLLEDQATVDRILESVNAAAYGYFGEPREPPIDLRQSGETDPTVADILRLRRS